MFIFNIYIIDINIYIYKLCNDNKDIPFKGLTYFLKIM